MNEYLSIKEIIKQYEKDIEKDIKSLKFIKNIDFIDIFPKSEEHKLILDKEAIKLSSVIEKPREVFFICLIIQSLQSLEN